MKKKFLWILMACCLIVLCTGCFGIGEDPETNDPVEPPKEAVLESIYLRDADDKEIVKDVAYVGEEYRPSGILVYAKYDNETIKNVTSVAQFSKVDTTSSKNTTCTVSYQTKEVSYDVEVKENTIDYVLLDISEVDRLYEVGDIFNANHLKVKAKYASGTTKPATNYTLSVQNELGNIHPEDTPFAECGTYTVVVSLGSVSNKFDIGVYNPALYVNSALLLDDLVASLSMPASGKYNLEADRVLYEDASIVLKSGNQLTVENKDSDGRIIDKKFGQKTYHSLLRVDDTTGISITLLEETEIIMIANGNAGVGIQFEASNNKVFFPIRNDETGMRLSYIQLAAGTYHLVSSYGTIELYDLYVHHNGVSAPAEQFQRIELDKTNVSLNFSGNESFEASNLKVFGVLPSGQRQLLNSSDYRVELDGIFSQTGTYTVIVTYIGTTPCLSNTAEYEITYTAASQNPPAEDTVSFQCIVASVSKTDFFLEPYALFDLHVYGIIEDQTKEELYDDEYGLCLMYQGSECNNFFDYGVYELKITYIGSRACGERTTTIQLNNHSPIIQVVFTSSGIGAYEEEQCQIDLSQPVLPGAYIKEVTNYTFAGFSNDLTTLSYQDDGLYVKCYYVENRIDHYTITYLGPNYCYTGYVEYVTPNGIIPKPDVTTGILADAFRNYTFQNWSLEENQTATSNQFVLPICRLT